MTPVKAEIRSLGNHTIHFCYLYNYYVTVLIFIIIKIWEKEDRFTILIRK